MIVVSDTTPLITLMKASRLELLQKLFGTVHIPKAVFDELTANAAFAEEADLIRSSPFIQVVAVRDPSRVDLLRRATGLDRGESEAIVYADDVRADLLLMDEVKGRQVARRRSAVEILSNGTYHRHRSTGCLCPDTALRTSYQR